MYRKEPTAKQVDYALYLQELYEGDNKNINRSHTKEELLSKRQRYVNAYIKELIRAINHIPASEKQIEWAIDLQRFILKRVAELNQEERERFQIESRSTLEAMKNRQIYRHIDNLIAIKNGIHSRQIGEQSQVRKR